MFGDFFIVTETLKQDALARLGGCPCSTNELATYLQIGKADCYKLLFFLERDKQIKFNFSTHKWEVK